MNTTLKLWLSASSFLLLVAFSGCQSLPQKLDAQVQAYYEVGQFNGSISVVHQGKVLLQKGYGWADQENRIPNTLLTNYRIGSITKSFTTAALLLLSEQGKLSFSDTLSKWVPEFPHASRITLDQLASHTSGMTSEYDALENGEDNRKPISPLQLAMKPRNRPLDFEPGTKWQYSDSGYQLLGVVVERASGMSYRDFIEKELFTRAGMTRSAVYTGAPDEAVGYYPDENLNMDATWAFSAGALQSNVVDLDRWVQKLLKGAILQRVSMKALTTPILRNYAYGLFVDDLEIGGRSLQVIHHGGYYPGFWSWMAYVPELDLTLVMLSNMEQVWPQTGVELMGLVLEN